MQILYFPEQQSKNEELIQTKTPRKSDPFHNNGLVSVNHNQFHQQVLAKYSY